MVRKGERASSEETGGVRERRQKGRARPRVIAQVLLCDSIACEASRNLARERRVEGDGVKRERAQREKPR